MSMEFDKLTSTLERVIGTIAITNRYLHNMDQKLTYICQYIENKRRNDFVRPPEQRR